MEEGKRNGKSYGKSWDPGNVCYIKCPYLHEKGETQLSLNAAGEGINLCMFRSAKEHRITDGKEEHIDRLSGRLILHIQWRADCI